MFVEHQVWISFVYFGLKFIEKWSQLKTSNVDENVIFMIMISYAN